MKARQGQGLIGGVVGLVLVGSIFLGGADGARAQPSAGFCPGGADILWRGRLPDTSIGPVVLTVDPRFATAISSITVDGREIVDRRDHGRLVQSAMALGHGDFSDFRAEQYNPTEGGARADEMTCDATSRIISAGRRGDTFRACNQMAFWLAPGEFSQNDPRYPALNERRLSDVILCKTIEPAWNGYADVVRLRLEFQVPNAERFRIAQFEPLTAYLRDRFTNFYELRGARLRTAQPEDREIGGNAVAAGSPATGTVLGLACRNATDPPDASEASYGLWRFERIGLSKLNCVQRVTAPEGLDRNRYIFEAFLVFGTRRSVANRLADLVGASAISHPEEVAPSRGEARVTAAVPVQAFRSGTARGQKLCSAVVPNTWRDTVAVPPTWRPEDCEDFAASIGAAEAQLGCVFTGEPAFTWGSPTSAPRPNCGWR